MFGSYNPISAHPSKGFEWNRSLRGYFRYRVNGLTARSKLDSSKFIKIATDACLGGFHAINSKQFDKLDVVAHGAFRQKLFD